MKKIIIQLLIFLSPFILIAPLADVFLSKELRKSNTYAVGEYPVWNDILDGEINSAIVINGSSRAWVHINPTMIGDSLKTTAYNIGIDGHQFWLEYLRHSLLLKYNTKPKLIIQSLDVVTLAKRDDLYNPDQILPYMLFNNEIRNATISFKGYTFWDYELPLIRYYGKTNAINQAIGLYTGSIQNPVVRVRGYQGQNLTWNSDFDNAKKEMAYYEIKVDSPTIRLFERYLNECRAKNIQIIFVYTPEYIEGQKFVKNRGEVIAIYKMFSKKYNIPFYDYSNDTLSFHKKYFYNSMHLNKTGSEIFTNELIQKLKALNAKA